MHSTTFILWSFRRTIMQPTSRGSIEGLVYTPRVCLESGLLRQEPKWVLGTFIAKTTLGWELQLRSQRICIAPRWSDSTCNASASQGSINPEKDRFISTLWWKERRQLYKPSPPCTLCYRTQWRLLAHTALVSLIATNRNRNKALPGLCKLLNLFAFVCSKYWHPVGGLLNDSCLFSIFRQLYSFGE